MPSPEGRESVSNRVIDHVADAEGPNEHLLVEESSATPEDVVECRSQSESLLQRELANNAVNCVKNLSDEQAEQLLRELQVYFKDKHSRDPIQYAVLTNVGNGAIQNGSPGEQEDQSVNNWDLSTLQQRSLLTALIRSLSSFDWLQSVDRTILDSLVVSRNENGENQSLPPGSSTIGPQSGGTVRQIRTNSNAYNRRRNRRNQASICRRFCLKRNNDECENSDIRLQTFRINGQAIAESDDESYNRSVSAEPDSRGEFGCCGLCVFSKRKTAIFWVVAFLIILIIAGLCFAGFIFFTGLIIPTGIPVQEPEPAKNFTKTSGPKSSQINTSNATVNLRYDQFNNYIFLTKQLINNRSHIDTISLDSEFLHEEALRHRFINTNESCAQVTSEIICCETFCEGKLSDGYIATRNFSGSRYCGAWRYELNSAHICKRNKDEITIMEFWSAREYRFGDPSHDIVGFHAIDYLPKHIVAILNKNASETDQYCVVNFGRTAIKEIKCHNIEFIGLEPVNENTTRHIVYLQNLTWAVLTSKVVDSSLQWSIAVFKDKQLIFNDTENELFSKDNQLIVFGTSPNVKVCAIEFYLNEERRVVCTSYTFQA